MAAARWKIDGQYYDLRGFASSHPGGSYAIELSANHDVTDLFHSYHRAAALSTVKRFQVEPPSEGTPRLHGEPTEGQATAAPDPRMGRLRVLVEARTGRRLRELTTPPVGMFTNVCFALAYAIAIASWFAQPTLLNSVATGTLGWLFGGFIQHEACHSAFSRRNWANHLGRFAIVPWGDPRTWFCRHVVEHHPYTNTRADCDFQTDEGVGALLAHHGSVAAGPVAPWQMVTQLIAGAFVCFFYSTADVISVIRTRQPAWEESAAYLAFTLLWFASHYALHGSLFWCALPHLAFGICFSNITQWNHIQEEATAAVLLDVPQPRSFIAHQASACVDCAHDSTAWSLFTIFLNFQTLHHILPGISHHHFLWDKELRGAIVGFLEEEKILLHMAAPSEIIATHYSWLCEVGGKAAAAGREARRDEGDKKCA